MNINTRKQVSLHFTGTQVNYYFVCHRKLWLFSRSIQMEQESDLVFQGKQVGEESYDRRKKEIDLAGLIVLDSFDRQKGVIHEVKKSRAVEKAHIWQVRYYIYFLKMVNLYSIPQPGGHRLRVPHRDRDPHRGGVDLEGQAQNFLRFPY